ncbi:hypothetical protein BZL30_5996 [Mycobacterium kansasii]|uniref:Uncharacterized protein n=1 Tax=Mycobacterium kansasii TaxID=1768 RepID=A0A1V3WYN8_MYCKA|nr:hypothetical protein BZL30_5996 [Mycobacterium kansasii]
MPGKQRRHRRRDFIGTRADTAIVGVAAAAFAERSTEPIRTTSAAAAANTSGLANTNDITSIPFVRAPLATEPVLHRSPSPDSGRSALGRKADSGVEIFSPYWGRTAQPRLPARDSTRRRRSSKHIVALHCSRHVPVRTRRRNQHRTRRRSNEGPVADCPIFTMNCGDTARRR